MLQLKNFSRNLYVTSVASLLTDISTEMVVYVLPLFLAGVLRTPIAAIGLIEGVAEMTASLTRLLSGQLADRFNRKWLAVSGYALSAIAKAWLPFVNTWPAAFAARFADRLGKGIRTAPRDALIAASVNEQRRGAAFGFHRAADTLGAFIGVGLSALIITQLQGANTALTGATFTAIALLSVVPAALGVMVLAVGLVEPARVAPTHAGRFNALIWDSLPRRLKVFLLVMALFTLGNSADAFIVLRAESLGASPVMVLLFVLAFNFTYTVAAAPLGALSDRIGRRKPILMGWVLYAAIYLGFALSNSLAMLGVLWCAYGAYYALTEGTYKALIADIAPANQHGLAYGAFHATVALMVLPASLLAGLLWQALGAAAPFVVGAALALTAAALFAALLRDPEAQPAPEHV
ncbi:MAG: MFS transporter [Thermoflexales bacterium]